MKGFARVTKLSNIGGRADYISNPDRQESIVAASASVDWKPYQEFEMANQKTEKRNNEGREVIVALPNEWAALSRDDLISKAEKIAVTAAGKDTDMQWAVHWNKAHTNLHIHVIFSERQKEKNPGRWDRDIYLTADGKVARRKADRAKNEDGSIRPPVHRKGEPKDGFTAKDPQYKKRSWVPSMKQQLRDQFAAMGVILEKPQPLHEYHEGKGKEAPIIRAKNEVIRANNAQYKAITAEHPEIPDKTLRKAARDATMAQEVLHLTEHRNAPALVTASLKTHQRIMEIKQTTSEFLQGYDQGSLLQQQIDHAGLNFVKKSKLKKQFEEQRSRNVELRQKLDKWGLGELGILCEGLPSKEWYIDLSKKLIKAILLPPEKLKKLDAIIDQRKEQKREKLKSIDDQIRKATPARAQSIQPKPKPKTRSSHEHGDR